MEVALADETTFTYSQLNEDIWINKLVFNPCFRILFIFLIHCTLHGFIQGCQKT